MHDLDLPTYCCAQKEQKEKEEERKTKDAEAAANTTPINKYRAIGEAVVRKGESSKKSKEVGKLEMGEVLDSLEEKMVRAATC